MNQRGIFVVGSLNADLVQNVSRLPSPGETIQGSDLRMFSGGKGANQACAAARLGGAVRMAGRVGNDVFGSRLQSELKAAGVDISRIGISSQSTGAATIFVLPSGENVIVLSPGANADVSTSFAIDALEDATSDNLLLCQLEIPPETVFATLKAARARGMYTILDPAPARPIPAECFADLDVLTPNQSEAAAILGVHTAGIVSMQNATAAATALLRKGPAAVILKMGELGCLVATPQRALEITGYAVEAVDTTAAGDAFNGALAVALAEGADLFEAARFANGAAALSVTQAGAIQSMPDRATLQKFLHLHSAVPGA